MIQRFYVHNFRCLENFELPIAARPSTLLIGRNGAGKSTVGAALELLQSIARGTNRVGQLVGETDFAHGRRHIPLRFEIEVMLADSLYQYHLALELPDGSREIRVAQERLSINGKEVYSRDRAQVVLGRAPQDRQAEFLIDWHLVALPVIQEQSTSDPLHVFKSWLARMLILAPIPTRMTGNSEGDTLMPRRDVKNFGEWFSGLLAHSPAAYTQIGGYLKDVLNDFRDIKNPIIGNNSRRLSVQFQQDAATLSLPFDALSDGEKCYFICALVLASNKAYGPIFCFWDQPESYLSLAEVGHFVMALRRSFQSRGQLVVTSHNPEAIRRFSDENTLLLHRRSRLEPTIVRAIDDIRVNGDLVDALISDDIEPEP